MLMDRHIIAVLLQVEFLIYIENFILQVSFSISEVRFYA